MCPYWLLAVMLDRCDQDRDGHAYSCTRVPIGSLGEDLENTNNAISAQTMKFWYTVPIIPALLWGTLSYIKLMFSTAMSLPKLTIYF